MALTGSGLRTGAATSAKQYQLPPLRATLDEASWKQRLGVLHKQLYASTEFGFEGLMALVYQPPKGYVLATLVQNSFSGN